MIRYCDAETFDEDQTRLMVLDDQFNEIWSIDSQPPGLGHTFGCQFFDVDRDGKDELYCPVTNCFPPKTKQSGECKIQSMIFGTGPVLVILTLPLSVISLEIVN
ncbi:hypothetical protein CMK14_00300 [Candidatus Poribacteria bacterium]|nr:hypothetical protein [Candidatus Poribacteria bacterium]